MTPRQNSNNARLATKAEVETNLPPIPETIEAVLRSQYNDQDDDDDNNGDANDTNNTTRNRGDDDVEDREEQGLFEKDNATINTNGINGDGSTSNNNNNINTNNNNDDDEESRRIDPGPFYIQTSTIGDKWELTWPIWHMLPRDERRDIAAQHGMKTIGEFEEYMSLTRAVDESEGMVGGGSTGLMVLSDGNGGVASVGNGVVVEQSVSENANGNSHAAVTASAAAAVAVGEHLSTRMANVSLGDSSSARVSGMMGKNIFFRGGQSNKQEGGDDSSVSSDDDEEDDATKSTLKPTTSTSNEDNAVKMQQHLEAIEHGGLPCSLPDEILHKAFSYLPIDDHASLALVSPHWSRFTRSESLFKLLCQRIYLNQSKRKALHVSKFGNSYRTMLQLRPRVRTGGGLYVLKYSEVRKIQRDMWTEIPLGAILESVYYRYLYFFEDGRVMYALTHASPVEMIPRFIKMLLHGYGSKDKWGVWGRYQIKKDEVQVWAAQAWHEVCFQLRVIPSNEFMQYDNGDRGVCTTMALEKHMSSIKGNFNEDESRDLVNYEIPAQCYFRFLRDKRL